MCTATVHHHLRQHIVILSAAVHINVNFVNNLFQFIYVIDKKYNNIQYSTIGKTKYTVL